MMKYRQSSTISANVYANKIYTFMLQQCMCRLLALNIVVMLLGMCVCLDMRAYAIERVLMCVSYRDMSFVFEFISRKM